MQVARQRIANHVLQTEVERDARVAGDLDELDRAALRLLQNDGRITNRSLARFLGMSETACAARIKRMEDAGYIAGYAAILGEMLIDRGVCAWVDVRLPDPTPTTREALETALRGADDVVAAYRTAGSIDYLVKISAGRAADIEFYFERLRAIDVECHAVRESVILRNVKPLGPRAVMR